MFADKVFIIKNVNTIVDSDMFIIILKLQQINAITFLIFVCILFI